MKFHCGPNFLLVFLNLSYAALLGRNFHDTLDILFYSFKKIFRVEGGSIQAITPIMCRHMTSLIRGSGYSIVFFSSAESVLIASYIHI